MAFGEDLEDEFGGAGGQGEVAKLVNLCGYPHSVTYAETATMPRRRQRGRDAPAWEGVLGGAGGEGVGIVR